MDILEFFSEERNFSDLIKFGIHIAYMRGINNKDDASDIAREAFLQVFKECKKPHILEKIESYDRTHTINYLRKSMRNRCTNIAIKENRKKAAVLQALAKAERERKEKVSEHKRSIIKEIKLKLGFLVDFDRFDADKMKNEVHFFIEEKFGREKWEYKKEAINLFFIRFTKNLSLEELKELHPDHNIKSLNTEAHRILQKYLEWLKKTRRSKLFEME